jgi:ABC-2 type transport system ATP-binding protein
MKSAGNRCLAFASGQADNWAVSDPLLTIEHLRVDFPDVVAVDELSLTVAAGEVCGLIGPNGAGKTTTMRAVSGLQECTVGAIRVAGHDMEHEPRELKRHLGFMPDFCPVYEHLTAVEFLDHFARAYAVGNRLERIEECLALTWLTEKRDALCEGLSRGMKQRLVLAKTLLPDPQVLLLDEPASGLDPLGRIELRKVLQQLKAADKAVLISSHILSELSGFCTQAAIMERGRLVASGSLAELGQRLRLRRMQVKWRTDSELALPILRAAGVQNLEIVDLGATFDFEGEADALDGLLHTLVTSGVRVSEWRPLGDDLEQIFLRSGAKELM